MHRWTKISSDFICILEKIVSGRGSALDPAGGAHDAPPDPQVRPPMVHACETHTLRPGLQCPNYGHLASNASRGKNRKLHLTTVVTIPASAVAPPTITHVLSKVIFIFGPHPPSVHQLYSLYSCLAWFY